MEFRVSAAGSDSERPVRLSAGEAVWQVVGAVLGRNTFLVGPSPRDPAGEALVLVLPGVRIPEPEHAEEPISTQEWRVALWPADEAGNRYVDVGRPQWVSVVSLAYVIGLVELECPQHLSWVADNLERRLLNACIAAMPDAGGFVLPAARRWQADAEAMLDELDIAMSHGAGYDEQQAPGVPQDLLPGGLLAPDHPETHEPRLAPGWLRSFYRARRQRALATQDRGVQH
jgi:hypothetical protein